MKIGLIDCDSHNYPNLAQMKLSAYRYIAAYRDFERKK